jgi:hypothetical protein
MNQAFLFSQASFFFLPTSKSAVGVEDRGGGVQGKQLVQSVRKRACLQGA